MTISCQTIIVLSTPVCTDTTWTCSGTDGLEHSNCGNTRTTTPCTLGYQALQMIVGIIPVDLRYDVNNNGVVDSGDATLLMSGTPLRALITYAAADGSTPVGTAVCVVSMGSNGTITGTIMVGGLLKYGVNIPGYMIVYMYPNNITIGAC